MNRCICDCYEISCRNQPTQEDLLCDVCREEPDHGYQGCALLAFGDLESSHVRVSGVLKMFRPISD